MSISHFIFNTHVKIYPFFSQVSSSFFSHIALPKRTSPSPPQAPLSPSERRHHRPKTRSPRQKLQLFNITTCSHDTQYTLHANRSHTHSSRERNKKRNNTSCLSSAWADARKSRRSRKSHRRRRRLIWFRTCIVGEFSLLLDVLTCIWTASYMLLVHFNHSNSHRNAIPHSPTHHLPTQSPLSTPLPPSILPRTANHLANAPRIQSPQILLLQMHRPHIPRSRSQQGRIRLPRPLRVKVLRGQCQGQREDAGRGAGPRGWRWG